MRLEQAGSTVWRSRGWWLGRTKGELVGEIPVLGQNEGIIWRMRGVNVKNEEERKKEKELYYPMRKYYLDAQEMTPLNMEKFVNEINDDGVTFLRGYAGALVEFANYCIEHNISCSPRAISVVSNPIDKFQRRIIDEAFHCPTYDVYGSKECQNMAHECPYSENHLHVLYDLRHIDILTDDCVPVVGEEEGVVHVTSFTNYIMPLIRYNLGDRTHWIEKTCKCGLPFPLIHRVKGRESDVILDKNGCQVHAPDSHIYIEGESISGYQFVVHDKGSVTIKLIPNRNNPSFQQGIDNIKKYYTGQYAGRVDFNFELVDSIPHDNGKLRFIVYEKNN
jgi:phenylacetate-CoA ligase